MENVREKEEFRVKQNWTHIISEYLTSTENTRYWKIAIVVNLYYADSLNDYTIYLREIPSDISVYITLAVKNRKFY